MVSILLKEQHRYSWSDLKELFENSSIDLNCTLRRLKEYGVLKQVKASNYQKDLTDLIDEDAENYDVDDGSEFYYVFVFVGIITISGCVLRCVPKYFTNSIGEQDHFAQVVRVIQKYNQKKEELFAYNELEEDDSFNILALFLSMLLDYYEYGSYSNSRDLIEINGTGHILWDKTINETLALITNNRPYYFDVKTKKNCNDLENYFKRLHECVLTNISRELSDAKILELFGIAELELSEDKIEDFGETDFILESIEREINIQFNTSKQRILKLLHLYFKHKKSLFDIDCVSLYGTNTFYSVWEDVCKTICDDCFERKIGSLDFPVELKPGYDKNTRLKDLIDFPYWSVADDYADGTLIPDVVTVRNEDGNGKFIIIDAKYYCPNLTKNSTPKNVPGIESVTKQYLYQLAYMKFIVEHDFTTIENCFLMPMEDIGVRDMGYVSLEMFEKLKLQHIKVRYLNAERAYDLYLSNKVIGINELLL